MRLWPRPKPRRPHGAAAPRETERHASPGSSDPLAPLYGAMTIGSMPEEFEPKGDPKIYDDEIDPAWRDPNTADPDTAD